MNSLQHPSADGLESLTPGQIDAFMRDGYIVMRGAFPRATAEAILPLVWAASPFKPDDRTTWDKELTVVPKNISGPTADALYTPKVVGAINDLLGAGRYNLPNGSGYLVLNMPGFSKPPWRMFGGHVDGNFFHHHLDSREQGVVLLFIYADLAPQGGGTGIRVGSHIQTAQVLADSEPAGISCGDLAVKVEALTRDLPVIEAVGDAGDLLIMHPFTFHGSSSNLSDRPRMASNMCVGLKEKMNLARSDPADYSPVETAIVRALASR